MLMRYEIFLDHCAAFRFQVGQDCQIFSVAYGKMKRFMKTLWPKLQTV